MVLPAPGNAAIGEELRDEAGIRKFLLNWFAGQGINAFKNPYAARLVGRSGEIAQLMPGYFQQDADRRNFINQWAAQQWGGAAPSGGLDFSNRGIIGQIDQTRDVNGVPVNLFRSGDSDADAQAMAAWRNIANRTYGSQIQNTAARLEAEKGLQFGQWRQNNPTWSGDYADWRLGKTPTPQGFTPPAGGSSAGTGFTPPATTPPVNPNLTTFPSTPGNPWEAIANPPAGGTTPSAPGNAPPPTGYGQSPSGPQGSLTPPLRPTTPGGSAITNWQQLLDKYQGDRQNWGTRGFRPNPGAFSIGGLSYDPTQDQVTGYNNMSGQGRVTNRGNMMGQYLYTLRQYLDQRNRGGNQAIGLTPNMTDDQVALLAWQRLSKNAIGSTGFTRA
jgi:hypothetical protein